jgi:AraC-like DNA-binding protein
MPLDTREDTSRTRLGTGVTPLDAARLHEKVYAPLKILTLVQALSEHGVSGEAALAGSGLGVEQIRDADVRTSVQQLLTVGRNAVRLSPLPELGLVVGQRLHVTSFGLFGYALLSADTMRQGFEMAMRYRDLGAPVMPVSLSEGGATAIWHLPTFDEVAPMGLSLEQYRFFLDMQFGLHVTLVKDVMGPWCVPAEAHYPREWLDRAPHMANPITAAQMSETCERLMANISWQAGLTRRVYEEITRAPGRFPDAESVASSLCMTSRTLSRKLSAEGTSYSRLVASVRYAFALDYLRSTSLSIEDIAAALGFSDANSFRHAFKRWSGASPLEYRR